MKHNGLSLMMNAVVGLTLTGVFISSLIINSNTYNYWEIITIVSLGIGSMFYGIVYFVRFIKHIDRVDRKVLKITQRRRK
jgi:hypothetical protein